MNDASQTIIQFAMTSSYDALPDAVRTRATSAITDAIGVAHAGVRTEVCRRLLSVMQECDLFTGGYPLIGSKSRSNIADAAVFNGVAIHALDYDDTIHPGPLHPSCHILPALLSAATLEPVDGTTFLTAFVVGCEIGAHLALTMNPEHYGRGWHSTSTIGAVAAAMAVARLLDLDEAAMYRCLGIAVSSAAGLRLNIGTMTKPLHAGNAARAGLMAALLARREFTAAPNALDGELGYLAMFCEPGTVKEAGLLGLGEQFELTKPHGLGLKPYACCGEATGAVEASLEVAQQGVAVDEIDEITVATNERAAMILAYPRPGDIEQARFSLPFCAAAPLVTGRADLDTFSESTLHRPDTQRLMALVKQTIATEHVGDREFGAFTTVHLRNGTKIHTKVTTAKGWAERFLTESEQRAKFVDCLAPDRDPNSANELFDLLARTAEVDDMRAVIERLSAQ